MHTKQYATKDRTKKSDGSADAEQDPEVNKHGILLSNPNKQYPYFVKGEKKMENKKLNDKELENVNGGQAVLPLLSNSDKEEDAQMVNAGYIRAECPSCRFKFPLPLSQQGKQVACQECGNVFTVK